MLQLTTRSQVLGFIYSPIPLRRNSTQPDNLLNYEKYCIMHMQDQYNRLNCDALFITSVEHYSNRWKEQHKRLTCEKSRLDDLKKEYFQLFRLVTTPTNIGAFDYGVNFLKMRVNEQEVLVNTIEKQVENFETNMFAFLYRPLLQCIASIVKYCHYYPCLFKYMVHYQGEQQLDLTKILLTILLNSDVKILETDRYVHNIYHFPLLKRMEDQCTKSILAMTAPAASYQSTISANCKKYLHTLEERYLLIICQKIAVMVTNDMKKLSKITYTVWRLDGLGRQILSFLLSESLVNALIAKYGPQPNNGKRKLSQMVN